MQTKVLLSEIRQSTVPDNEITTFLYQKLLEVLMFFKSH